MNTVVIFSGRFQPFGKHHHTSYKHLVDKFGKDNVYVVTGNKVDDKSPFDFAERKMIIEKYGVPSDKIVMVKSPYRAAELVDNLPEDTAVVFAVGDKDNTRLNTNYYDIYSDDITLKNYSERHYVYHIPHISIDVSGDELCGTNIRKMFDANAKNKQEIMRKVMGFFDLSLYNLIATRCE